MQSRRNITFFIWIIAIAGALTCPPRVARILLAVIFVLLCTTPKNAIRLPRTLSEIFITGATMLLRWPLNPPNLLHLGVLLLMLGILRLWNKSPWWAVLYGWLRI